MNIYQEHILDHYKNPRNKGELVNPHINFHDSNPLCGDEITVHLKMDGEKIVDAKFSGMGCAVSQAGASMLFEQLPGKTVSQVLAMDKQAILDEFGVELSVSRVKCALLALSAVKKALAQQS